MKKQFPKTGYEHRSIASLFAAYQDENDRIVKEDAAITKRLIRQELHARLDLALHLLDGISNPGRVQQLYENQFIAHR